MVPHCRNCHQHKSTQPKGYSCKRDKYHNKFQRKKSISHVGCGICKKEHRLATCQKFLNLNLVQKYKTVERLHYCFNCFARSHILSECQSLSRCNTCKEKHHSLLHGHPELIERVGQRKEAHSGSVVHPIQRTTPSCNVLRTLVPTALVKIQCKPNGKLARAVVSSSSIYTIISDEFVKEHGMETYKVDSTTYTRLLFKSTVPSYETFEVHAMVSKHLPKRPYTRSFSDALLEKFSRIELADPQFTSNNLIYMEIGADLYPSIIKSNIMKSEGGLLIAQDTSLGWLIVGSATS
ncbi:uncharacterized protein LOC142224396 [Haematobia irritans]|uniref:uncharacterized protein LOC142224396 n=1 Tax=Haematobia irritans TaxID=7368 RepID=UPI003F50C838